MWISAIAVIFAVEIILLVSFIIGRVCKRKFNETVPFLAAVFVLSLALHIVPYIHGGAEGNRVFGLMGCFMASMGMFVGQASPDMVAGFAEVYPLYSYVYLLGACMALLATVSTAVEAFHDKIRNAFRLRKALKQANCDLVVGCSPDGLEYAKTCNAVLLLDDTVSKDTVAERMEEGFVILRKGLTRQLMEDRRFNTSTRYNVVCLDDSKALEYLDTFIAYKKANPAAKNVYLYVQLEEAKAETVRREIIEKNDCEPWIFTFCTNELLARSFAEAHPITEYLPKEWIDTAAIRHETKIHTFMLGFGPLSRELYRQCVLNNQLVTYLDGTYQLLPIHYHICDAQADADQWNITGLKSALEELDAAAYFPLPQLPFDTEVVQRKPDSRDVLTAVKHALENDDSFGIVIVDAGSDCASIEIGAKLKRLLLGRENYHIFVRSEAEFVEDDAFVTYFGKGQSVFSHDVIVNDSLSVMAKKLNQVYTAQYAQNERNRADFVQYIEKKAEEDWNKLDYFTLYSNIYGAMSLRLKLHLLGLDYKAESGSVDLLTERYPRRDDYTYDDYREQSVRNALIAQEHARWNAYHLLGEYLPLKKDGITVKPGDGEKVRFRVKDTAAKLHACLTTYSGLNELSSYLAQKANCEAKDYDYYIYDEMLITSAQELLGALGYSVTEK